MTEPCEHCEGEKRKAQATRDEFQRTLRMTKSLICNLEKCARAVADPYLEALVTEARERLDVADARCEELSEVC